MSENCSDSKRHQSVLVDHKMVIEGKIFHERKELVNIINEDGILVSLLSHLKAIGDRKFTAKRVSNGEDQQEFFVTEMSQEEIEAFNMEWDDKWVEI